MKDWFLDKCKEVYDFRSPCQIEIFWLKQPELHLIVVTHFKERQDKEIIVNGPYYSNEFIDKVESVLEEPRWSKATESIDIICIQLTTEIQNGNLITITENAKQFYGQSVGIRSYAGIFIGNIANAPYELQFREIEEDMKDEFERRRVQNAPENPYYLKYSGYGVHFFPPIIVGKKRKLPLRDILQDPLDVISSKSSYPSSDQHIILTTDFNEYKIIVKEDGFIWNSNGRSIIKKDFFGKSKFEENKKDTVVKILNTIMSIGVMAGLDLFAVREHELLKVRHSEYCGVSMGISIEDSLFSSTRSIFYSHKDFRIATFTGHSLFTGNDMKEVEVDTVLKMIKNAVKVFRDENIIEDLQLLIESYTNIRDKDYNHSFILSWTILERYLSNLWRKTLENMQLSKGRIDKLTGGAQWSVDKILEVLNIFDKIDKTKYDKFMNLKYKRNKLIHAVVKMSKEDAEICFKIASEIVMEKEPLNRLKIS